MLLAMPSITKVPFGLRTHSRRKTEDCYYEYFLFTEALVPRPWQVLYPKHEAPCTALAMLVLPKESVMQHNGRIKHSAVSSPVG